MISLAHTRHDALGSYLIALNGLIDVLPYVAKHLGQVGSVRLDKLAACVDKIRH